ncbi:pullulanase-type alpha-1,6-glucosidase [Glutamicibacter nicotianae]|uniref:pullulanase-type alpha-1,6-glucosidase n=1 Tax=Glutamicibacter nicotianae TaxID=37929 RepID=UPI00195A95F7|nr:pullulanase-type alpha-1,6-glucosidase [Glutamicibacter nicotianae]MBM7769288.1 pullulanase-type alpha-1,6-glucosidase [Glutamicibacter nicotianae]
MNSRNAASSVRSQSLPPGLHKRSWRRWVTALAATPMLALAPMAPLASIPAAADETSVTLAGSFQSLLGCSADWMADCEATSLQSTDQEGQYSLEVEVPAGNYEYKVALNKSFDTSYGLDGGEENIPLALSADSRLRFTFDTATGLTQVVPLDLRGEYSDTDADLVSAPVRQAGSGEQFYFVMTDRFANGSTANDTGGLEGDRLTTGFDPTNKGFFQGGDIAGLRSKLDYIQGLGTSAIWLTPSFKNMPVQGSGDDASAGYHGYWVTDFTQIDPHLGTNEELSELIDDAHKRGIKVYFDIIVNHTADLIDYKEKKYSYVEQSSVPYKDAQGQAFDPADYAGSDTFPELDASSSFPYTPVVSDQVKKVPDWLNDPTLYHNRGDSTWEGESVTYGDFQGLDDLMTENPKVVNGFAEVYKNWVDLGIDGFRIDTAKHVNFEFWEQWTKQVQDYARAQGKDDFFMFGEVYDADAKKLSPYVRKTEMNSVLDFTFQSAAAGFAGGNSAKTLSTLFSADDYYTTANTSADALPTFLGNHDMGRIGYFLNNSNQKLKRVELAHELMFLTRGQPVVYYGDEQGFAGTGGDKDSRQSLFASQVSDYQNQELITGEKLGTQDRYDSDSPLYQHIAALSKLRESNKALKGGAQVELYAQDSKGVYAFSRVDRDEKTEYLVALNNSEESADVELTTLTSDASYSALYGAEDKLSSAADAKLNVTVPALSAVVYKADKDVDSAAFTPEISAPKSGAGLSGVSPVSVDLGEQAWAETSMSWREVGTEKWHLLGVAEGHTPRVFHDVSSLPQGTLVEYRAVSTNAAGEHSAASTYASVGNDVSGFAKEKPVESDISMVTVPGSHNTEMGCVTDWDPACEAAKLTEQPGGVYSGEFEVPAGDYEYKVAINGSWDLNYGVGGVAGGDNLKYSHEGGSVKFFFDPRNNIVQSDQQGPMITLPGSFQDELGCASDWDPTCLATLMADPDADGTYEFTTEKIPAGTYEFKVSHNFGWEENYGVDGAAGGANYSLSVTEGKPVSFSYDSKTHLLQIGSDTQTVDGVGQMKAQWISADTIAIPRDLGSGESYALYVAKDAGLKLEGKEISGAKPLELKEVIGGLSAEQRKKFPHLADYRALRIDLKREDVASALRSQMALARFDGEGDSKKLTAFTGVQSAGVIDDLYAKALEDVELGVSFTGKRPTFRLWAPTAQNATLLITDKKEKTTRYAASYSEDSGVWTVKGKPQMAEAKYRWEVLVYVPETGKIETNIVTDPYSVALTTNSTHSVAVSLEDPRHQPKQWRKAKAKNVEKDVDRSIYELQIRDFSISDASVPENQRGRYGAFGANGAGSKQLKQLSEAGLTTVHLLPSFDIATIEEEQSQRVETDCDLKSLPAASSKQQECVTAHGDEDGFNWGYDPFHFMAPEGSYATNPEGANRVEEFRSMVGSLHSMGLEVVLDQVFNHTAASGQADRSVLDKIVPGYYHRLDATGKVETSTCCQNLATEHAAAQKLMVDAVVVWAKDYKVDGFRFDLMGHHSRETMEAVRSALDELKPGRDGVDGKSIYLYGEGWNFGEVADNARFYQATQGQLNGTGIGTFNDRLRDAVHGGSPVDSSSTFRQGFGTGLGTDPNGNKVNGSTEEALKDLGHETDLVKLGLAGNLEGFEFLTSDGSVHRGDELNYRGAKAGYASQPGEVINYVDAHDNETLYDLTVLKLPRDTSMEDRVRMNTLSQATVMYSQAVPFWHAGTELLRSKSLDRNSYNSGDWFNRIDFSGVENTFGSGLPPKADNGEKWDLMAPLLEDPALKPDAKAMAAAEGAALDLLRTRKEVGLLRLGSADLIEQKVSFPLGGSEAEPGIIVMRIDDTVGKDADRKHDGALVLFNASPKDSTQTLEELVGHDYSLAKALAGGSDDRVKSASFDSATGELTIPARTAAVLVEPQGSAK